MWHPKIFFIAKKNCLRIQFSNVILLIIYFVFLKYIPPLGAAIFFEVIFGVFISSYLESFFFFSKSLNRIFARKNSTTSIHHHHITCSIGTNYLLNWAPVTDISGVARNRRRDKFTSSSSELKSYLNFTQSWSRTFLQVLFKP